MVNREQMLPWRKQQMVLFSWVIKHLQKTCEILFSFYLQRLQILREQMVWLLSILIVHTFFKKKINLISINPLSSLNLTVSIQHFLSILQSARTWIWRLITHMKLKFTLGSFWFEYFPLFSKSWLKCLEVSLLHIVL